MNDMALKFLAKMHLGIAEKPEASIEVELTSDLGMLMTWEASTSPEEELGRFVREKMLEMLRKRLPDTSDPDELFLYYSHTSGEAGELVKKRLAEAIPSFSDMRRLLFLWEHSTSDPDLGILLEKRIIEVYMKEVTNKSSGDLPEWFFDILRGVIEIPDSLRFHCNVKAREILY